MGVVAVMDEVVQDQHPGRQPIGALVQADDDLVVAVTVQVARRQGLHALARAPVAQRRDLLEMGGLVVVDDQARHDVAVHAIAPVAPRYELEMRIVVDVGEREVA
ncbi:hypothetical protein BE20_00400 [Sorangium cellulosum]|nr:hypothetical protein BE20_00400 [Sorangium cellulosum]